jgi:lathosterol oxidase
MLDLNALLAAASKLANNVFWNALYTGKQYVIVTGVFLALCLWWQRSPKGRMKLQARSSAPGQIKRELWHSLQSIAIFACVIPLLFVFGLDQYMRFYPNVETYGWPYFFVSIVLMMLVQDTYFYWTHRLMHRRALFRMFHRTHHLSTNPNPLTTYAVNPLEALVDQGATVIILFAIPSTGLSLFIFSWFNVAYAVYGHLGYELFPRGTSEHWLGRWINTSTAHNEHHSSARYNFGWYFLFWDRMMGTLSPRYSTAVAAPTSQSSPRHTNLS